MAAFFKGPVQGMVRRTKKYRKRTTKWRVVVDNDPCHKNKFTHALRAAWAQRACPHGARRICGARHGVASRVGAAGVPSWRQAPTSTVALAMGHTGQAVIETMPHKTVRRRGGSTSARGRSGRALMAPGGLRCSARGCLTRVGAADLPWWR